MELITPLLALVPTSVLLAGSIGLFVRRRTVCTFVQLLGAACLIVVVFTHISESLHLFPWMRWGLEDSPGHYLDLVSAILGLTLFPAGYLAHALRSN
jgi:ABC-type amino acid transport system permease subunit